MVTPIRRATLRDLVNVYRRAHRAASGVAASRAYRAASRTRSAAAGWADELSFDRGVRQRLPADRSAVDQADHVRSDAGQPLRGLAEADRRADQAGLVRPQRLQDQQ